MPKMFNGVSFLSGVTSLFDILGILQGQSYSRDRPKRIRSGDSGRSSLEQAFQEVNKAADKVSQEIARFGK